MNTPMNLRALRHTLGPLLRPLSHPYARLMKLRRDSYITGRLSQYAPGLPCISVGNIAWGGTGKTPLVSWLLDWAREKNLRATVLTRGYGGKPGKEPLEVRPDTPVALCGDEPLMLARNHPEAAVVVSPKRAQAALYAERHCDPHLFILDDGMQHLAMARHADIVLLRPEDLGREWNRVIPSGSWREGPQALRTAAAFAVKADPETFSQLRPAAEKHLGALNIPFFSFTTVPCALSPLHTPAAMEDPRNDEPYLLVSGIGNPRQFSVDTAIFTGCPAREHLIYPDHHPYTRKDVLDILHRAGKFPVICTAKDAVKLSAFSDLFSGRRVYALQSRLSFGPSLFTDNIFPEWWEEWWQNRKKDI